MAADVVVIGAGMVGAACAYYCRAAGLTVTVVERGSVASGTTGAGEGNVLVSDKEPGPELDLALWSARLWSELAAEHGDVFEYEPRGGLVVASTEAELAALDRFADGQQEHGVAAESVTDLAAYEPHLAPDLAGGRYYPQDTQVQPMLAAAHLLRRSGATVLTGTEVVGITERGVRTSAGDIAAGAVVNAAGTWSGALADVPILPRRGFVLVTEPLPPRIRHKVYAAGYVADVAADDGGLRTSPVVEGTKAGTVLIGASRERVGFDRTPSLPALRALAAGATALFPFLAGVNALRAYCGFRPYSPDHLPLIGPDPRRPGLWHACGHEGAGIGLAPATGALIAALLTGGPTEVSHEPFRVERFVA
ncbi:MAG TPA: FAD-binding oxidoreductase [Pseudonocardiaceae bacterium]|nr:FAD-binding oxidoreductase [Pseudonocardiaceae bacterium]